MFLLNLQHATFLQSVEYTGQRLRQVINGSKFDVILNASVQMRLNVLEMILRVNNGEFDSVFGTADLI